MVSLELLKDINYVAQKGKKRAGTQQDPHSLQEVLMYSTVTFEGNLAADIEVKGNKAGGVYVDAVVLVNQGKDSDGTDRTPTRWQVRITSRIAENAVNLRKGARLLVTGSVVTDSWTDKQTGEVRYATRVLAQPVGVSLTFARVTGIERNTRAEA